MADEALTDAQIRAEILTNLATPGDYVVVNLFRPALGQAGGGHFSPLAAYDEQSDSLLLLDVDPALHKWAWYDVDALIGSMRTRDKSEKRGYLLVSQ